MRILLDADPVVYAAGYVSEDIYYEGVTCDGIQFRIRAGDDWANLKSKWKIESYWRTAVAHPTSEALLAANSIVDSLIDNVVDHYKLRRNHVQVSPFLSSSKNFRHEIARQKTYKGNRDQESRPIHYQRLRDHLVHRWGAKIVSGREADDEVSILARQHLKHNEPYVVATVDKDLDQIPGPHYNYRKHVFYDVNDYEARRAFWIQVLAGDSGDNVPGCYGVGVSKAAAIVDEALESQHSDNDIWQRVLAVYLGSVDRKGCPYDLDTAEAVALETAQLVYMQQTRGELWAPPGEPRKFVKGDHDD
jgi:hypothetical protein